MRYLSLLLVLALFQGCAHRQIIEAPKETPVASPSPSPTPVVAVTGDKVPSIVYDPIYPYYKDDLTFIKEGERQANAVLASPCFKSSVLTAKFSETNNLSNEQIYAKFVKSSPYKVGIELFWGSWLENKSWHTVGYEGDPIRMNRYFVWSATYVASTSLHEGFGHGLDFRHDYDKSWDSTNIPYTLNRIFEKCAKQLGFKIQY